MKAEEMKAKVQRMYGGEQTPERRGAIYDEFFDADCVYHGMAGMELHGREEIEEAMRANSAAFPDLQITLVENMAAEGDRVVSRVECTGTHQGEFRGTAPTGKKLTWQAISILRFEGGKVKEWWWVDDRGVLMLRAISS